MEERRAPTPLDPRFRRSLFVMLVTLGVLIAAGYMQVRDAKNETKGFKGQVEVLGEDNERLRSVVEALTLAQQRLTTLLMQRSDQAKAQRDQQQKEIEKLQQFILLLLSRKNPYVTITRVTASPSPSSRPGVVPSPAATPGPKPTSTPAPTPSPTATCVDVKPLHICLD